MATRFYIPASAEAVAGFTPSPDAGWEDVSILVRNVCRITPIGDAMATVSFADNNATNRDVLFRQSISPRLSVGQTITGGQALKAQFRCAQVALTNNMFLTVGIRVIAANGTTVQKTVLAITRDGTEAATTLTNRQWTATSAATNYTTVAGDRLVIETGMAGDPDAGSDHDSSIRFGDAAGTDLAEDDTATADNRPWVQLNDTLAFEQQLTGTVTDGASGGATFDVTQGLRDALAAGSTGGATFASIAALLAGLSAGTSASAAFQASQSQAAAFSAGIEAGDTLEGEIALPAALGGFTSLFAFWLGGGGLVAAEETGDETGTLTAGTAAGATFSGQTAGQALFAAGISADAVFGALADTQALFEAAAAANDSPSTLLALLADLTANAQSAELFAALMQAVSAIQEGVAAGDAWATQIAALADYQDAVDASSAFAAASAGEQLAEQSAGFTAGDELDAQADALGQHTEGVSAGDSLDARYDTFSGLDAGASLASLFAAASAGAQTAEWESNESVHAAEFLGALETIALLAADVQVQGSFAGERIANAAFEAGMVAGSIFTGTADVVGTFIAAASASATFETPSELRLIVGTIVIAARIAGTVDISERIRKSGITIEPRVTGTPDLLN